MKIFILFFSFVLSFNLYAQTADSIRTGRPGQAIGPYVLGTGLLQIQSGLDFNNSDSQIGIRNNQILNNIIRFGIDESFELSALVNWRQDNLQNDTTREGVSQFHLGFRYNVVNKSDGWLPAIGIQTRFKLKAVNEDYRNNEVAPAFLLALGHKICDSLSLNTNLGMSYSGNDATPTYNYVFSFSHSLSESWGLAYEFYGNEFLQQSSTYTGLGVAYLLNPDFQFDGYMSYGSNQNLEEVYASVGISWRTTVF